MLGWDGAVAGVLLSEYPTVSPEQRAFDEEQVPFIGPERCCWHGIACLAVSLVPPHPSGMPRPMASQGAHSGRPLVLTLDLTKDDCSTESNC